MRLPLLSVTVLFLCAAAGPTTTTSSEAKALEPLRPGQSVKVLVDALAGPNFLVTVKKGETYYVKAAGKWKVGEADVGAEGHDVAVGISGGRPQYSDGNYLAFVYEGDKPGSWDRIHPGQDWQPKRDGVIRLHMLGSLDKTPPQASGTVTVTIKRVATKPAR